MKTKKSLYVFGIIAISIFLFVYINPFDFKYSVYQFALVCPGGYQWEECPEGRTEMVKDCTTERLGSCVDKDAFVEQKGGGYVGEINWQAYVEDWRNRCYNMFCPDTKNCCKLVPCQLITGETGQQMEASICTSSYEEVCPEWVSTSGDIKPIASGAIKNIRCVGGLVESCGNGICEPEYSETPSNCRDCEVIVNDPDEVSYPSEPEPEIEVEEEVAEEEEEEVAEEEEEEVELTPAEESPPSEETIASCAGKMIDDGDPCTEDLCYLDSDGEPELDHRVIVGCGWVEQLGPIETIVTIGASLAAIAALGIALRKD